MILFGNKIFINLIMIVIREGKWCATSILVLVGSIPTPKFFSNTKNFEGGRVVTFARDRTALLWRDTNAQKTRYS
jgi:hypothetical protein